MNRRSVLVGGVCFLLGATMAALAATAIRPEQFIALPWSWTATQTFDGTHTITGLPSPSASSDVATKAYVLGAGGTGTVTSVTCNGGLTGGAITTTGTCALDVANPNTWTATQSSTPQTLTISTATFTPAVASGNNIKLTLVHASCPCTFANWSGTPIAGTSGVLEVIQSSTGSDTIGTWGSQYVSAGGTSTLALSTAANAIDFFSYYVIDSTHTLITSAALNATH